MAAKSKAYTTDDGKTAVKEDSSASSQVRKLEIHYDFIKSRKSFIHTVHRWDLIFVRGLVKFIPALA